MQAFFQGISFRLAKIGVVLAFLLGMLMSSIQLYFDFAAQERQLQTFVNKIIEVAMPPAARAVHTLDDDLSAEVVNGLLTYDFIYEVAISDELDNTLAAGKKNREATTTRWLTQHIAEETLYFDTKLVIPGYDQTIAGTIHLKVDTDKALVSFYDRSYVVLIFGLVRNMLLVLLLFFAFHKILTKPLIHLLDQLKQIDTDQPGASRLDELAKGRRDELTQLVATTNNLLDSVELSLAKRRAVEFALRRSEEHIRQIIDSLPIHIGARDGDGRYIFANKALARFFGREPEQMQNITRSELPLPVSKSCDQVLQFDKQVIHRGDKLLTLEESYLGEHGNLTYFDTQIMPLTFYDQQVALVVSTDVTERKQAQAEMEHMAYHDSLTGLPNRVQLVDRLEHEIRRAQRHGYYGSVIFIDLDQFKNINDSLGHPIGDQLLQQVAERLREAVREEDMVARLSGDEFIVVLTVLDQDIVTTALRASEVAEKIRHAVSQPYDCDGAQLRVTCSAGIAVYPDRDASAHELLRYADTAMYQVKDKGRDAVEFFNEDMADKISRQLVLEGELHTAIDEAQFELYFQPKVDANTGQLVGAEALIRWNHPERGMVSPFEFIPILEASGMILTVGQWVLEESCRAIQSWQERGFWSDTLRLSINVSPRQFRRRGFADDVTRTLQQIEIPRDSLEIEITEGIVIQNVDETVATMTTLASEGIAFSLDDFGTGYSSISYLKKLPVSVLKIDKSFVDDIMTDRNDQVLVETMITMGRLLEMEVVAEGVESEDQLELLKQYGCHIYQGYLFSKPVEQSAFEVFLKEHSKPRDVHSD